MDEFESELEEPIIRILSELTNLPECQMCGKRISRELFDKVNRLAPDLAKKDVLFDMRLLFTGEEWEQLATHHFRWFSETIVKEREKGGAHK